MNADEITGALVRVEMADRDITQAMMGDILGITQAALGKKLHGQRSWTIDEILVELRQCDSLCRESVGGFVVPPFWTPERSLILAAMWCQVEPDAEIAYSVGSAS